MWIYLLVLLFGFALADDISPECKELYKDHNPRPCCNVPNLLENEEFKKECKTRCDSTPDDSCCPLDCLLEVSGVIANEELNKERMKEMNKEMNQRYGEALKQWVPKFDQSQKECREIFDAFNENPVPSTCQAASLIPYLNCLHQKLFINCPVFEKTESCEAVKKFTETQEKCGLKAGETYVLDSLFWRYLEPEE